MTGHPRLLSASARFVVARLYFAAVSYGVISLLARTVGAAMFSRYVAVMSVLAWVELLASGLNPAVTYWTARGGTLQTRRVRRDQFVMTVCLAAGLFLAAGALAAGLRDPALVPVFRLVALDVIPFGMFMSNLALLSAREKYGAQLWGNVTYSSAKLLCMGGLIVLARSVFWAMAGMVLASTAAWAATSVMLRTRETASAPTARRDGEAGVSRRGYFFPVATVGGQALFLAIDVWFLGWYGIGAARMGEYGAAQNIVRVMLMVTQSAASPVVISVARAGGLGRAFGQRPELKRVVLAIVAGLTATAAVFSLAAGPIVRLLFGPAYENAIPLLRWMAPTQAVLVAGLISLYVLFQSGRMAAATAVLPFGLAAFLLTAMALTPRMGPAGATLGLAAAGLVFLGYTAAQARGAAGRAAPPAPAGARSSAAGRVSADEPPPR